MQLFFKTILLQFLFCFVLKAQNTKSNKQYLRNQEVWVNDLLSNMTLDEKIGQLFMIAAFSNRNEADYKKIENYIQKYHIGGVLFFQGNPYKQAELTNRYQNLSKIPLFVGLDAEWGLGMRLDNAQSFPKAITLGACQDPELVEKVAYEIGRQCKRIGVNYNFAPDADINSNPKNPIINFRSFGESPTEVAQLAVAFNRGLKKAKILGSAKHFPGHGDTDVDSHKSMPILFHTKKKLDELDTFPFRKLIADSVASVMVGHLFVPVLENSGNLPASVSPKIVNDYLKRDLAFDGLVVTDALNMQGLLKHFPVGTAEVKAFEAGNDLLLQTANIDIAFNKIKTKLLDSTLSTFDLNIKVKKILKAKYWLGLNNYQNVDLANIYQDLNTLEAKDLMHEVFRKAITLIRNENQLIPLKNFEKNKISSLAIGASTDNVFQKFLKQYGIEQNYNLPIKPQKHSDYNTILSQISRNELVIVSVHGATQKDNHNFGITNETLEILNILSRKTKIIVCVFANPYSLRLFENFDNLICGYEDDPAAHLAMANALFGINGIIGKIPVNTLADFAKINGGIQLIKGSRLGYETAQNMGFDMVKLNKIKEIANEAIQNHEFPGCQILVAKQGKVVFHQSFGNLRYNNSEPVYNQTIYDVASISKVVSTLQIIMKLYDENKLDINKKLSFYLPELKATNKKDLIITDILWHQAGLQAFIPFWKKTMLKNDIKNPQYYADESYGLQITPELFVIPSIKDSVYRWIDESELLTGPKRYVYSDLGLLLLQRLIERITGEDLDVLSQRLFYAPLGMNDTSYNPYRFHDRNGIAPTEIENIWRKTALQGNVHDPNAALLGGIAGHAGIFSTSWDLAKILQMNLNKGEYGGTRYFSPDVLPYFTKTQSNISHRALGWNKPIESDGSVSEQASANTFGHTGFTGSAVWVDPDNELIYVFLSNRVFPDAENNKILKNKTRKRVHDAIYDALK